jgi:hypothetical protein
MPVNLAALVSSKNSPTSHGTELISANSRLTSLDISPPPAPFYIIISEAYGDDGLFTGSGYTTHCLGDKGQEYCGTSTLTTAITQRL